MGKLIQRSSGKVVLPTDDESIPLPSIGTGEWPAMSGLPLTAFCAYADGSFVQPNLKVVGTSTKDLREGKRINVRIVWRALTLAFEHVEVNMNDSRGRDLIRRLQNVRNDLQCEPPDYVPKYWSRGDIQQLALSLRGATVIYVGLNVPRLNQRAYADKAHGGVLLTNVFLALQQHQHPFHYYPG